MMGAEVSDTDRQAEYVRREDVIHAAAIREALRVARGLAPMPKLEWVDTDKSDSEGGEE